MDLLIRNGRLVDGTGAPERAADVVVAGDRIREIAPAGSVDPRTSMALMVRGPRPAAG